MAHFSFAFFGLGCALILALAMVLAIIMHTKQVLLLLVRRFRLRWDPCNNDSSLLHIFGSGHDEGKHFATLVPGLRVKNNL